MAHLKLLLKNLTRKCRLSLQSLMVEVGSEPVRSWGDHKRYSYSDPFCL